MTKEIDILRDEDSLRDIATLEDAFKFLQSQNVDVVNIHDLGDGFRLIQNKDTLCGVELAIIGYRFHQGDNGEFVVAYAVARNEDGTDRKVIIVDGSTGICQQLKNYSAKNIRAIWVPDGLKRSDYTYTDDDGKERPATTFYLSS